MILKERRYQIKISLTYFNPLRKIKKSSKPSILKKNCEKQARRDLNPRSSARSTLKSLGGCRLIQTGPRAFSKSNFLDHFNVLLFKNFNIYT